MKKNHLKTNFCFVMILLLFSSLTVQAQLMSISGIITDESGDPLPSATVILKGTSQGVSADINGNYTINGIPEDGVLVFSFFGMASQELAVAGRTNLNVVLVPDNLSIEETVVIGYGSAKAKDLTAPINVVKNEKIMAVPSSSPMTALQGKVPGVNVINSGTPGSGPIVQIRGIGSFSNSTPLFIVDGMFYDDINFLNNSDVQEVTVLKDASAAAIYGVRAANGVIIITTKKGSFNQKPKVTYEGYAGVQIASNVLKLCNAEQYATMLLEGNYDSYQATIKKSIDLYGGSYASSDFHNWTFGADNDWYSELLRPAGMTNHSLSVSGGSEKATYSVGASYLYQDGILNVNNNYKRFNLRGSVDFEATRWLKLGFNGHFSNSVQQTPNNSAWQTAFNCPPIVAKTDESNEATFPNKYGSPDVIGYTSNFYNPLATAEYHDSKNLAFQALGNFYGEISFIPKKLVFRSSYSYSFNTVQGRSFTPTYYVSSWQQNANTSLTKNVSLFYNYIFDNTLTYNESFGKSRLSAMAGFSAREEQYRLLSGKTANVQGGAEEYLYLKNGDSSGATVEDNGSCYRGLSAFARVSYNYADKYILTATFRADGSSKYQEHWGYFPSVGAAWVISQEPFMAGIKGLDYAKLRVSWGKLGNDHVAASDGFSSITTGKTTSGVYGNNIIDGYQNDSYFSWLRWEVVNEFNAGINLILLQNRLSIDVDYYRRITENAVISPLLPFSTKTLAGNYGRILNTGVDILASWEDRIGKDFRYGISANISTLKNRVIDLSGATIIKGGKTVNIPGEQMNSYYGFKMVGVYQTEEECANDPIAVANGLVPGDLKYADLNGDDVLDGNDRTCLGSYIPNLIYGLDLTLGYKGWDFSMTTYGQAGAQIFNRKRALRYAQQDYNFDLAQYKNRWTSAGSTNTDPSAAALLKTWNVSDQRYSSYFVESADFFRIQNITLGYTFRNINLWGYVLPGIRLALTADRPFTTFKANTFTPELTDKEGWDTQVYPLTSTYLFSIKIDF